MSSFDRDKFYKRLGVNPDAENSDKPEADLYMVAEVQTTENGSVEMADKDEITLTKSVDLLTAKRKPDLQSFDYEAFYKKQGVYDSPREHMAVMERQMTTEEYEQELAD